MRYGDLKGFKPITPQQAIESGLIPNGKKQPTRRAKPRPLPVRQLVQGAHTYTAYSAHHLLEENDSSYRPWGTRG